MKALVTLMVVLVGMVVGKEHSMTMDPEEKFTVTWSFEDTEPYSNITFTISCKTTGWIALGFSPNGAMTDADIVIAWVRDDGTSQLKDMHATANSAPSEDSSADVQLLSADETDGVTTVTFKRKLNTCDNEHDNVITSSTTRLIYAYKDSDPSGDSIGSSDYHGTTRGVKSVYLLETKTPVITEPEDAVHHVMTIDNYKVPARDTTYYCKFFKAPNITTKHHIVSLETLVTEGNLPLVHHLLLYGCWGVTEEHMKNTNKTEGVCYGEEMPEFADNCRETIYAWAVGGGKYYFPEEAGYAIGDPNGDPLEYYMMEMHYDNPGLLDTWVDSSGVKMTYTPTPREKDVGILGFGMVDGIAVPPKPDKFRIVSYCDSSCTNQWIPETGIEAFSYGLHSHLLGAAIQVEWFRDGKHIGMLAEDSSYDFNFQESRHFETNKKLLPGDTLKITCTYTDPKKDEVTYGGLPSSSEMCLAYVYYYPRVNVSACASVPGLILPSDPVYNALSVDASGWGDYANMMVLQDVTWDDNAVSTLQDAFEKTNHYGICHATNHVPYETSSDIIEVNKFPDPEEEEEEPCPEEPDPEEEEEEPCVLTCSAGILGVTVYAMAVPFLLKLAMALC